MKLTDMTGYSTELSLLIFSLCLVHFFLYRYYDFDKRNFFLYRYYDFDKRNFFFYRYYDLDKRNFFYTGTII